MSLKEIAQRVGVSPSTVSRVLNNKPGGCVSSAVRERVWQAARELGYHPNLYARQLRQGAASHPAKTVCVLMTRSSVATEDPFFLECCAHIESELLRAGCTLGGVYYIGSDTPLPQGDGYLLLGRCPDALLRDFQRQTPNLVGVWRNPARLPVDEVICSGQKAAHLAMDYLVELGHRKIAYIGDCSYEERFIGYSEALVRHHLPLIYSLVHNVSQTRACGFSAMQRLLQHQEATAVLCANDETALGALEALRGAPSKAIPLSVIGIDDIAASAPAHLTTVHMPGGEMAHLAVLLLLDRMGGGHREFVRTELPCRLIERESCFLL